MHHHHHHHQRQQPPINLWRQLLGPAAVNVLNWTHYQQKVCRKHLESVREVFVDLLTKMKIVSRRSLGNIQQAKSACSSYFDIR
jgi:hypothetical protein